MADDESLRADYAAHATPTDPHPDELTWERLATDELRQEECLDLAEHVTRCAECRAIHRGLRLLREEAWQAAQPASALWRRSLGALAGLAAAAGLVFMLGRPGSPSLAPAGGPTSPPAGNDNLRQGGSGRPVGLEPQGQFAAAPTRFRWRAVPAPARYRVQLLDDQGEPVWSSPDVESEQVAWPSDLRIPAGRYHWQVAVRQPGNGGHDALTSALVDFEITSGR